MFAMKEYKQTTLNTQTETTNTRKAGGERGGAGEGQEVHKNFSFHSLIYTYIYTVYVKIFSTFFFSHSHTHIIQRYMGQYIHSIQWNFEVFCGKGLSHRTTPTCICQISKRYIAPLYTSNIAPYLSIIGTPTSF